MKNQKMIVPAMFAGEAKQFSRLSLLERVEAVSQRTAIDLILEEDRDRQFARWFKFLAKQAR